MAYRAQHRAVTSSSDTGSFRSLVEHKITPDEYVERLDERVRERHEVEDNPSAPDNGSSDSED